MDQAKNFAKATLTAGIDDNDTSLTVDTGQGARFPSVPFNVVVWNSTDYPDPADDPSVEIMRVTDITGDTFTVTRGQEGTAASEHNSLGKAFQIIAPLTAKVLNEDLNYGIEGSTSSGEAMMVSDGTGWKLQRDLGLSTIGDVADSFNGTVVQVDDDNQRVKITRQTILPDLPSSDPHIVGALYRDGSNFVKWSVG